MSNAAPSERETPEQRLTHAQEAARNRRYDEAEALCVQILAAAPRNAAAMGLLGTVATSTGRPEEGCRLLEKAIQAGPSSPALYSALAASYQKSCRMNEALNAATIAVRAQPTNAAFLVGLAMIQIDLDQHDQATISLLRAIGQSPTMADAHLGLAQLLLARGEMAAGWLEYEWRNRLAVPHNELPRMTSPAWNGMRMPRARILLIGDQGYGDTVQFARYIPLVAERCAEIIVGCSAELTGLLSNIPGVVQVHHRWDAIPPHAANCRLSSLPMLFQTRLDNIPGPCPYLFPDPARIAAWARRLGPRRGPRIGLAWSGRPTHPNDRRRSLDLTALLPLGDACDAEFVCLQKPVPARDAAALTAFNGMIDLSEDLHDFTETAALIVNLDLVVTIDSVVAHIAGALAKPAWVLLAKAADWRWMLERDDSPWYPSLRLFRQRRPGAWDGPIAEVAAALRREVWT